MSTDGADAFTYDGGRVLPGETKRFQFPVSESYLGDPVRISVTIINGPDPGPTAFLSAASHGDEAKVAAAAAEAKLESLRETVTEIDDIVAMLNEIVDQTNMLALNASIEAARVGEAGSDFAVVADEVKDLAEQAQERATEIEATVEEVRSTADETIDQIETVDTRTDTAAASITDAVDDLDGIADSAVRTSENVDEVAETTQAYADDLDDIARDVIDAISQANEINDRTGDATSQ